MMNDCAVVRVREALPEYLHGTLDRRQRLLVQAHLATCGECASELALLERCRAAMSSAPTIDVGSLVAALPEPGAYGRAPGAGGHRLSPTEPIPLRAGRYDGWLGRRAGRTGGWRIAAVALLTVGALGVVFARGGNWSATGAATGSVAVGPAGPLRVGDRAMPAGAAASRPLVAGATLSLGGGLSDLSDDALDALLLEVDAMEALPLVEPPTVGVFVVTEQTGAE